MSDHTPRRAGIPGRADLLRWVADALCLPSERAAFVPDVRSAGARSFGWLGLGDGRGYLIPLQSRRAAARALDLYTAQRRGARLARQALAAGMRWGLGRFLLPTVRLVADGDGAREIRPLLLQTHLEGVLGCPGLTLAISSGMPGRDRKPVVLALTHEGTPLGYVKVGWGGRATALVRREVSALQRLRTVQLRAFTIPRILHAGRWQHRFVCVLSAPAQRAAPAPATLQPEFFEVLKELASLHIRWVPLLESAAWRAVLRRIARLSGAGARAALERGARQAAASVGTGPLPFHFSHGDFAPWNIKLAADRPFVFDWEYWLEEGLPARDLFHFLFQTQRIERRDPAAICAALVGGPARRLFTAFLTAIGAPDLTAKPLLLLYCADQLAREALAFPGDREVETQIHEFERFASAADPAPEAGAV
jgi:hypothetical protein